MLKVTIVVGNPKPQSRTRRIANLLVDRLLCSTPFDLEIIDLAHEIDDLYRWPSDKMKSLNSRAAESDLVVFASPTYKASYTGLLKAFLDRYPANGLKDVVAIALMTGNDFNHSLAPTFQLVPLLLELGAIVPMRGLYFNTAQMDRVTEIAARQADELAAGLRIISTLGFGTETTTERRIEETDRHSEKMAHSA